MAPILITLDGNIGAGKSTLLEALRTLPHVTVIPEPVGTWLTLRDDKGESLLSLFYKDTERWCYTFQNCAILTRLLETQKILEKCRTGAITTPFVITERSILTDRYVFAEMLRNQGKMTKLEWDLYNMWFDSFAKDLPYQAIIHLTTSPTISSHRINLRGRKGETLSMKYLQDLDDMHNKWISNSQLPSCTVNTENEPITNAVEKIRVWLEKFEYAAKF
jgi:deoxyguanosine kinase